MIIPTFICLLFLALVSLEPAACANTQEQAPPLSKQERYQQMLLQEEKEQDRHLQPRVVGGTQVPNIRKYPFFLEWEDAKCGASLIHDDVALSAAHCENDGHPFDTRLFMLSLTTDEGLARFVQQKISHPLYSGALSDFDFMILKLDKSALVDDNGTPTGAAIVDLNRDKNLPAAGDALIGMGFGKKNEDDSNTSDEFREVEISYIDNDTCLEQYGVADFLEDIMFCGGVPGGGKDTCQGDSGGPIMHKDSNTQVGVVSFGIGCARADYAGVNARVSSAVEWIDDQICELSDMPPARCNGNGNANGSSNGNANGSANGSGNGNQPTTPPPETLPPGGQGKLTVYVTYDGYPQETAWSLTYLDMPNKEDPLQLYLHPFDFGSGSQSSESFDNLPAGTYSLQLGDQAGDGMCCTYGNGNVYVTNDNTDDTIWSNSGNFGEYVEVQLLIDATGVITVKEEDYEYDNSWEAFDAVNHPPTFDQQWPGVMPFAARNTIAVNVKFDAFPQEITWTFYEQGGSGWTEIQEFDGRTQGETNQLVSVEFGNLAEGWHRFSIRDSEGDGICCSYRRGWASLTAPLITTRQKGLVWGNNGEFGSGVDVYVNVDAEGFINSVSYTDPLVTSQTRSSGLRRTGPGERRDLETQPRQVQELSLTSSWTDLPKQPLKRLPWRR